MTAQPVERVETATSAVLARGLVLDGPRGRVYGPLDLDVPRGTGLVLGAPAGSGRTSLLLTLAGRMRPTAGTAIVLDHRLPDDERAVQRLVALAPMRGVNELDGALSVGEHVHERLAIVGPAFRGRLRRKGSAGSGRPGSGHPGRRRPGPWSEADLGPRPWGDLAAALLTDLPDDRVVRDLSPVDRFRLGIALALLERPQALVVDDLDDLRDPEAVTAAWQLLAGLPLTVLASASNPDAIPAHVLPVFQVIR